MCIYICIVLYKYIVMCIYILYIHTYANILYMGIHGSIKPTMRMVVIT